MLKRLVDVFVAASLLLLFSPLLVLLCVLIRRESRGPAIFRQTRMGRNFKPFEILKLRTMREVPGAMITLGHDQRITRLGRWLRRTRIDEIPQFWNVLRGEMSLVGPRPVVPALTFQFREQYQRLLQVRPGLTDPATIKYCRENELLAVSENPLAFFWSVITPEKLRISMAYQESATLLRDLLVLLQTALVLLPGTGRQFLPRLVMNSEHPLPPIRHTGMQSLRGRQTEEPSVQRVPVELLIASIGVSSNAASDTSVRMDSNPLC